MPEFDIDSLKKSWQQQPATPKYNSLEIEQMLNRSSRNYVKYILWISILEFILILGVNVYYGITGSNTANLMSILGKFGVSTSENFSEGLALLYLLLKIISLALTGVFVILFYHNYQKINIEHNLKNLILHIIRFRKSVQWFIFGNIILVIVFTVVLTVFSFNIMAQQQVELDKPALIGFLTGITVTMGICVGLIWIYYRLVYGFILRKLGNNLKQLQNIEEGN